MEKNNLGRCSELVSHQYSFHPVQCSFKAVVVRDRKGYCKKHDPEYKKAKRKEQDEKWDKESNERAKKKKRTQLEKEYCKYISTEELERRVNKSKEIEK